MAILRSVILALCISAAVTFWIAGAFMKWAFQHPRVLTGGLNPIGATVTIRGVASQGQRAAAYGRTHLGRYVEAHHPAVFNRLGRIFTA